MRPVRLICVLALVALTMRCGDKNPTRPSGSGTAVTGLAITGPDAVLTGLSTSYTLTATSADGTTRTVTPAWTSSNPAVASVGAAGLLGGRSHGSTTLTATYDGRSVFQTRSSSQQLRRNVAREVLHTSVHRHGRSDKSRWGMVPGRPGSRRDRRGHPPEAYSERQ